MTKRTLWHKADPDTDEKGWHEVTLEAIDAVHALNVDPGHWKVEKPMEEKIAEVIDLSDNGEDA